MAAVSIPDFKESELEDNVKDKLKIFFSEVNKLKAQYTEHHRNETELMSKCRELQDTFSGIKKENDSLKDNSNNIDIKTQSIKNTITNTEMKKKELSRTLELKKKELKSKRDENDNLLINLENITNELEVEREELTKSLEKKIDTLFNKKNQQVTKLNEVRIVSSNLFSSVKKIEDEKSEIVQCINKLNLQIEETNLEIVEKKKTYKNLELDILNNENDADSLSNELKLKKEMIDTQKEQLLSASNQVKEASNLVTENHIKLDSSQQCLECLQDELKILNDDNVSMKEVTETQRADIEHFNNLIAIKQESKNNLTKKMKLLNHSISKIEKETYSLCNKRENWQRKCSAIKQDVKILENKLTVFNKQFDAAQRERELIESYHQTKSKAVQNVEIMLFTAESGIKNLDNEISANQAQIKKSKKNIEECSADLKKKKYELSVKKNKSKKLELKHKKIQSVEDELQAKICEGEKLLKQQQNLIEAVRMDKNVYNKSLIDQKEEMKVFRRNFNTLNHQINQIKMELSEKDQQYITEHFNVDQVDKDVLIIRGKIEAINKKIFESDKYIEDILRAKLDKLNKLITSSDQKLKSQHKQYNEVISESKNLSTKLIHKNKELIEIKEKIRLLNSMFSKGNSAYNDKCKLLISSQQIVDNLALNIQIVENNISEISVLESQILSMENDLLCESLKVQSLRDELCRPVNIHRWRQLKDTNPEIFTMIEQSHKLTKKLLTQNKEIYEKQQQIQDKEKLYVNLRKILARQPGNEAREQLNIYLSTLNEKKGKLKQLTNQLNIYRNKVHLLKHQINILNKDKNGLRVRYLQMKKRQSLERSSSEPSKSVEEDKRPNDEDKENVDNNAETEEEERDASLDEKA